MPIQSFKKIIISRTDNIGDVLLTFPLAAKLKSLFPDTQIFFLGKSYTKDVINACVFIDQYIDKSDFLNATNFDFSDTAIIHIFPQPSIASKAKRLKIPVRIGTSHRFFHWFTCNRLVNFTRKNSNLHEAQLNFKLLAGLGIKEDVPSLQDIYTLYGYGLKNIQPLPTLFKNMLNQHKFNLIIHPTSNGNGKEWKLDNFITLIKLIDKEKFNVFVSGTEKDQPKLQPLFDEVGKDVINITGKMNLAEFISFINSCDGLIASGTGPIHLAAALNKYAFGLYPPLRFPPAHPGRWAPIGKNARTFVIDKDCNDCRKKESCACINSIQPQEILNALEEIIN